MVRIRQYPIHLSLPSISITQGASARGHGRTLCADNEGVYLLISEAGEISRNTEFENIVP